MEQKSVDERVRRRLYSLYPEHIVKLEKLAKARKMPQSQYLRELIEVAYAEAFPANERQKMVHYGAD